MTAYLHSGIQSNVSGIGIPPVATRNTLAGYIHPRVNLGILSVQKDAPGAGFGRKVGLVIPFNDCAEMTLDASNTIIILRKQGTILHKL